MPKNTILLEDIFDPSQGWDFPLHQVPIQKNIATDGNTVYLVTVDGIVLTVFEQTQWAERTKREISPNRIVAMTMFLGVTLNNPLALLQENDVTHALPAFGVNEDGNITFHTAIPISPTFPLDLARKQLMVCMGLLVERSKELLLAWNKPDADGTESQIDWESARNVASVAGIFLRAFLLGA